MRATWWCVVLCAACGPQQPQAYSYKQPKQLQERPTQPVAARVVTIDQAVQSGLQRHPYRLPFEGEADGTKLISDFLTAADTAGATYVADLAIFLQTTIDGRAVECRTDVDPETVTETRTVPGRHETVSVNKPVQRMVTESEYRCKPVTKMESRTHTEYEQRCATRSHPVSKTRTVYRSEYDYYSKSTRSVPHTEYYTDYESRYECHSEPVTKTRMESVSSTECSSEMVTRMVTRFEFQLESKYIPPRLEQITRQRLKESEPACYVLEDSGPPSTSRQNRIEGWLFSKKPAVP